MLKKTLYLSLLASFSWVASAQPSQSIDPQSYIDLWQLYQQNTVSDPRIVGAEAQIRSAEGQERSAFGQMLPQLSANTSFTRVSREQDTKEITNGETYSLRLSQALYNPAAWRGFKKYSEMTAQYRSQYEDARVQSTADLVQRYFAALAAEDELELATAERRATQRNLDSLQAMFERRLATITDVLQISARVDSLKTAEIEARNQIQVTREALAELIGHDVYQPFKRIDTKAHFDMPLGTEEQWVGLAVANNPALKAKQKAVEAANYAIDEARAGHLPTLTFGVGAQRSDFAYENVPSPRTDTYSANVTLQVPIYSGGSTSAKVEGLYGSRDAAEQEFESVRRQVIKETRTAYMKSASDLSKIASSRSALDSAVKARIANERSLALGVATAVDVLNAVKQEYSARRDYLQAQYDFITNQLVLLRWRGNMADADILKINDWLTVPTPGEDRSTGVKEGEIPQNG
ncbi:outer membrane protein [Pseudomonas duriflava]|uniref:Outer membrane protein n=1 Tax=Pseudomonas duriflava TaxID=459528 RepID=A0A562PYN3_9PSED|nr:TolC family outer membrane protein [Pseudomonas duriflava]TWI49280.1 outer membrane protein [Pseudomonas duriflava]